MSNSVIRLELATRLKDWADAQDPPIEIAFQNVPFEKPGNPPVPFLESLFIPNTTLQKELSGSRKTYMGIYQVNVWAGYGRGMRQAEDIAQAIINLYPMLPKSGAVSIESTPTAEKPLWDTTGWVIVPVTIKYRMETF